jgi:hypothetical protein
VSARLALPILLVLAAPRVVVGAGHGPLFGAATPTLGKGGWSVDTTWMVRRGETEDSGELMLKSMLSYGVTEKLQISISVPLVMTSGSVASARTMSAMSNEQEIETMAGYRFQRRVVGVGGRQESTVYVGFTAPLDSRRGNVASSASLYVGAATGYASRSHYIWVGGGIQRYAGDDGMRQGTARFGSVVYGFRPRRFRVESDRPDARVFVEATAEDRTADTVGGIRRPTAARSVFVGPTTLVLYKAAAFEAGILWPAYQRVEMGRARERFRLAANVSYFFWLK